MEYEGSTLWGQAARLRGWSYQLCAHARLLRKDAERLKRSARECVMAAGRIAGASPRRRV